MIGETSHIGNYVKLYQGVTLGAKSFPLDEHGRPIKHIQRHPTVEDHVIIYANSTILGGDTTLGERTVVAGNVFLMESTPPDSFVTRAESGVQIRTRSHTQKIRMKSNQFAQKGLDSLRSIPYIHPSFARKPVYRDD